MTTSNKKQLKITTHGMDSRFVKHMAIFLRDLCLNSATFKTETDESDVDLFDHDVPASRKQLEKCLEAGLLRPALVLSLHNYAHEGIIAIKKPVTVDGMMSAVAQATKIVEKVSKITIEFGITAIPRVTINSPVEPDAIRLSSNETPCEEAVFHSEDQLQQISDWFDKKLTKA